MTISNLLRHLSEANRGWKQAIGVCVDSLLVLIALWASYGLRYSEPRVDYDNVSYFLVALPIVTCLIFARLGVYRWIVRSSNMQLFVQLAKGAAASAVALLLMLHFFASETTNAGAISLIYVLVLMALTCGARVVWRGWLATGRRGIPVAIYGAGSAGVQLAQSLTTGSEYKPVCFIDDDKALVNSTVLGSPVFFGGSDKLADLLRRQDVSQVVLAIPSLDSSQYEVIFSRLENLKIPFKTVPSFAELMTGSARFDEIRDVSISDILGRTEVLPDPNLLRQSVLGKSVLVTGGGGSIGSELCRQIIRLGPSSLTVLDNSEANLYHVSEEIEGMLQSLAAPESIKFNPVLCSVTDQLRIKALFVREKFDVVFHAAAYKHVPIVERQPEQGVEVNVFGTRNVVEAAIENNVGNFVLISTDKAVRPTNSMGATKRVAELVLQAKASLQPAGGTIISMVRFGNVLASTGSVVPKFKKQIEAGGPITLTDLGITRYFMTIPEASQLVLQSTSIARGGDVFVLDMGEPIKILHLAETMIKLHCRRVEQAGGQRPDIRIAITGLRPGEKMYEELFIDDSCRETHVAKVMSADEKYIGWDLLEPLLNDLGNDLPAAEAVKIKASLFDIVDHKEQATAHDHKQEPEAPLQKPRQLFPVAG